MSYLATQLTAEAAEAFDRRVHNVPETTLLGWTPYQFRVTRGAVNRWACVTPAEFMLECRRRGLRAVGEWTPWVDGVRTVQLVEA